MDDKTQPTLDFQIVGEYRQCPHGYHHPPWAHACDGCWCEGERDRREYGWPHDTTPQEPVPDNVVSMKEHLRQKAMRNHPAGKGRTP